MEETGIEEGLNISSEQVEQPQSEPMQTGQSQTRRGFLGWLSRLTGGVILSGLGGGATGCIPKIEAEARGEPGIKLPEYKVQRGVETTQQEDELVDKHFKISAEIFGTIFQPEILAKYPVSLQSVEQDALDKFRKTNQAAPNTSIGIYSFALTGSGEMVRSVWTTTFSSDGQPLYFQFTIPLAEALQYLPEAEKAVRGYIGQVGQEKKIYSSKLNVTQVTEAEAKGIINYLVPAAEEVKWENRLLGEGRGTVTSTRFLSKSGQRVEVVIPQDLNNALVYIPLQASDSQGK